MGTPETHVPVICMNCGHNEVLAARHVTASLMCSCGSDDLDFYEGTPEQLKLAAGPKEYPGTTSVPTHTAPPTIEGWNEYAGPMPSKNNQTNGVPTPITCPVCHGSGFDPEGYEGGGNGGTCRECHGTGVYTPMTDSPPPMVARHPYPSTQTAVPFMGSPGTTASMTAATETKDPHRRYTPGNPEAVDYQLKNTAPDYSPEKGRLGPAKPNLPYSPGDMDTHYPKAPERSRAINYRKPHDYSAETAKPFVMHGASCPTCGHDPLHLAKDHKEDAWATCPNCGPLVNIDKHPNFDPYNLRFGVDLPNDKFKKASRRIIGTVQKTGRLLSIIATVHKANPGLDAQEVVTIARQTVARY